MSSVIDGVISLMRTIGAPGVGIAIAVETVFPPIPSEVVLPLAGFTASQGHYPVWSAIIWATIGSLVGAWTMYALGYRVGADRLRVLAEKIPLTGARDVDRSIDWFSRHGRSAVFFGRLLPGVRSLISIPAGIDRMPLWQFTLYTGAGSAVWNAALVMFGFWLGAQYTAVEGYVSRFSAVLGGAVALALGVVVVRRLVGRYRDKRAAAPGRQ